MSADQVLDVMGTFRRKGSIMPAPAAQAMLDNGFGIDITVDTAAGKLYNKNGLGTTQTLTGEPSRALPIFCPTGSSWWCSPIHPSDRRTNSFATS